jgi:hypothetical protein
MAVDKLVLSIRAAAPMCTLRKMQETLVPQSFARLHVSKGGGPQQRPIHIGEDAL